MRLVSNAFKDYFFEKRYDIDSILKLPVFYQIKVFLTLKDIPDQFILTRYINPPHLINNKKYDFRVYILVTGLAPFRLYIYTEGLVRFASEDYSTKIKDLTQLKYLEID